MESTLLTNVSRSDFYVVFSPIKFSEIIRTLQYPHKRANWIFCLVTCMALILELCMMLVSNPFFSVIDIEVKSYSIRFFCSL